MRTLPLLAVIGLAVLSAASPASRPRVRDGKEAYVVEGVAEELEAMTVVVRDLEAGTNEEYSVEQDYVSAEVMELPNADTVLLPTTPTTTASPRCRCRPCWKDCKRKGYNWGLCLFKRCHCFY